MAVETTAKTGVDGRVGLTDGGATDWATSLDIYRWDASFQRDIHDVTPFVAADGEDDNARTKIGGMLHVTGTFAAYYTGTTPPLSELQTENYPGAASNNMDLVLQERGALTAHEYSFKALLSNINVVTEKTGLILVTASFESTGEITVTTP